MKQPWKIAAAVLLTLGGAACSSKSPRRGETLNYQLSLDVAQSGSRKVYSQIISVTPSQTYNYGAGWKGWGGLGCRLTGSAVPIGVEGGTLFATLKRSIGTEADADQCGFLAEYFGIPNGDKGGKWVDKWNAIAASERRFPLGRGHLPLFLFIPAQGGWPSARLVRVNELPSLGVAIEDAAMTITRSPATIAPQAREAHAAYWRLDRSQMREMPNDVIEGLKGLIAEARN